MLWYALLIAALAAGAPLRPEDIAAPTVYGAYTRNGTLELATGGSVAYAEGEVAWPAPLEVASRLTVLPGLVAGAEVEAILAALDGVEMDTEPDSVDGMPSHEMHVSAATK